jgi:hypothetical protein
LAALFLEINLQRRVCLIALGALPSACITPIPYPASTAGAVPVIAPQMRLPKLGQQWVYAVRNIFNQETVDTVTETIVQIGEQIRIERNSQKFGPLADEIQGPWGKIIQDPHWQPAQKFIKPLPLWPEKLELGWSGFFRDRYQVLGYPDADFAWLVTITAVAWEKIRTPAGSFLALKYSSDSPYFESNDVSRLANLRNEETWLVPEIGRWAIRRSMGRYLLGGMIWTGSFWEDYLEWELQSWK